MKKSNKFGFTLVELLAVIVILAIILVIAVPKVMSVIEDAKKATLESTAKMIASAAEKQKVQNTVLGNTEIITCDSVVKLNNVDYEYCSIGFKDDNAEVIIRGNGKFAGLSVCKGTKTSAVATNEECVTFFEEDDWATIVSNVKSRNYPYQVGDTKTISLGDKLGEHEIRVSNVTPCDGTLLSQTACGFVLEFVGGIVTEEMNETIDTNLGGWPATSMRTYLNSTLLNAMPEELRGLIIDTYVVSGHGKEETTGELDNDNFGSIDKLYLLSTMEVWGSDPGGYDTAATKEITRQLDYYIINNVTASRYEAVIKYNSSNTATSWWLRSAAYIGNNAFYYVRANGEWNYDNAIDSYRVSPAFRVG